MATIRKKRNKYSVRICKKGYPIIYKSFTLKCDAIKWAKNTETDMERNVFEDYSDASTIMLKDILIRYRDEITPTKKGAKSETYKINKLINHKISNVSLLRLKSSDIALLKQDLKHKAPQTIKHYIQQISVVWNTAKKEWGINLPSVNPCSLVTLPKVNNQREQILTYKQWDNLLANCSFYIKDFVFILYHTGARYSELANLRHKDVNLNEGTISFLDTKNGDDRKIPITNRVIDVLKKYRFGPCVFNLNYQTVYDHFQIAKNKAGIPDFRMHDLRACFCTNAILSGLSLPQVAALSGHKSWSILKKYTRIRAVDLKEKVNNIVNLRV